MFILSIYLFKENKAMKNILCNFAYYTYQSSEMLYLWHQNVVSVTRAIRLTGQFQAPGCCITPRRLNKTWYWSNFTARVVQWNRAKLRNFRQRVLAPLPPMSLCSWARYIASIALSTSEQYKGVRNIFHWALTYKYHSIVRLIAL